MIGTRDHLAYNAVVWSGVAELQAQGVPAAELNGGYVVNGWLQYVRPEQIREFSLVFIIILAVVFFGTQISGYYSGRTFNRVAASVASSMTLRCGRCRSAWSVGGCTT